MAVVPVIDQRFDDRLRKIERKHHKFRTRGTRRHVGPDGLVVQYPRRNLPRFPLRGLVLLALLAFVFKVWMFTALDAGDYMARIDALAAGNVAERAAAWVMQPEAVTAAVSAWVMQGAATLFG